ncbi:MAG: glycosyltransferase family 4 protein [bacterium]
MNSKEIRLLFLLKDLNLGGVERSTLNFANSLIDKIGFIGIVAKSGFFIKNNAVNSKITVFQNFYGFSNLFLFINNCYKLIKIISQNKINIVHYHFRVFLPYVLIIKIIKPHIKIVYTHHFLYNDFLNYFLYADKYLAISESNKNELKKQSFISRNVDVLENGINLIAQEENTNVSTNKLGFVGRFVNIKGLDILVGAFQKISINNKNAGLIIRGIGTLDKKLFDEIENNHQILLLKAEIDIVNIYKDIEILVVPCRDINGAGEGLPNIVILEAMMLKIPVIAAKVAGVNNILKNNENILFFEPENINDLIEKILLLQKDTVLFNKLKEQGYETVINHYSLEVIGKKLINYYLVLLA